MNHRETTTADPSTDVRRWALSAGAERLECGIDAEGLALRLAKGEHSIDAKLRLRLAFYVDHMNNMHPFPFDDRIGHAAERQREDIVLFDDAAGIEGWAATGEAGDVEQLVFRHAAGDFEAELHCRVDGEELRIEPVITNASDALQRLMVVRLELQEVKIAGEPPRHWRTPPTYKGKMATDGPVAEIPETDMRQLLLPMGLVQPLILLGGDKPGEPRLWCAAWLNTYASFIVKAAGDLAVHSFVNRKLEPRQRHELGPVLLRTADNWRQSFSRFAEEVPPRFGFASAKAPDWAWQLRALSFPPRLFPIGDERWRRYLEWGKAHGFNATIGWGWLWKRTDDRLCAIAPHADGLDLDEEHGATEQTVRDHVQMHRDLGMRCFLWTPTTGAARRSPALEHCPQWFCRDKDGNILGSWGDPDGEPWLYDSNPINEDYHRYWLGVTLRAAELGFDGVFFDGVIARPSDEFHGTFPGEVQDGMIRALRRLREELDARGLREFLIKPEGGDVSMAPASYWMNGPVLHLQQPEPPMRRQDRWRDVPRAFLQPDYPRRPVERFNEHFESVVRAWPPQTPGNASLRSPLDQKEASPRGQLGLLRLMLLSGNIWNLKMLDARLDPDAELPGQDPAARMGKDHEQGDKPLPGPDPAFREFRDALRELNAFRETNPWLAPAGVDCDLMRTDDGACPAFVRVAESGERLAVIVNLSEQSRTLGVTFADRETRDAVADASPVDLTGMSRDIAALADGKVTLEPGEAIAAMWTA